MAENVASEFSWGERAGSTPDRNRGGSIAGHVSKRSSVYSGSIKAQPVTLISPQLMERFTVQQIEPPIVHGVALMTLKSKFMSVL